MTELLYKPLLVTLTGVDARTDLRQLVELAGIFPCEFAVLLGKPGNGRRYMPPADVFRTLDTLYRLRHRSGQPHFNIAVHLCGAHTRYFKDTGVIPLINNRLLGGGVNRVQINGWQPDPSPVGEGHSAYAYLIRELGIRPILQWKPSEAVEVIPWSPVFDYVQDSSGGRGVPAERWSPPAAEYLARHCHNRDVCVGYAGGLDYRSFGETLPAIAEQAEAVPYWIDMETRLRDHDDDFDIYKCQRTLETVASLDLLTTRLGGPFGHD